MNSMFSSFDALSAEFFGQTVKANFPLAMPARRTSCRGNSDQQQSKDGGFNNGEVGADAEISNHDRQQKKEMRFAPEHDGLFCFETIVS
ncbi:hypothetical protein CDL15_Pgr027950 [Punica granatum]|uniref:Uncharacterized protein n=1 Tax=Punica granatum TaxID=22663 RepID=A0A218XJM4_PUNGR|nr:hypothetical protein CDL15_Pgr027950 [Punica granatum]PKI75017.1 hypothetical protein CRG98_004585 [Punica granatum]